MAENNYTQNESVKRTKPTKPAKFVVGLMSLSLIVLAIWGVVYLKDNYHINIFDQEVTRANTSVSDDLDMSLFWRVLDLIDETYIDREEVSKEDLLYGAISGLVGALGDPYTSFYTPEENTEFKDGLEGVYGGIGAQLGFKENRLVIVAPLEGTPAEEAGLRSGDMVLAVDGEATEGWSLAKAVSEIRGDPDTTVVLTLQDGEVEVTRRSIKIPAVRLTWVDRTDEGKRFAHIRILRFGTDTIDEWSKVVKEVKLQQQVDGIVLDLRNNPGGLLNAAIYLASEFFTGGVVVEKETKSQNTVYKVDHTCRLCEDKVTVLINGGSASASEILAGAIQRRSRGVLVGEKSFGKGSVQESIELEGNAAVHITNARWLLPDGENITEQGLEPDHLVETSSPSGPFGDGDGDAQLEKAIEILINQVKE